MPDPREFAEFEAPLIQLAQLSRGAMRKLLTAFFGFLHRRTDFYCISSSTPSDAGGDSKQVGFQEGDAEKLLLAAFRQFPLRKIPLQQPSSTETTKKSSSAPNPTKTTSTTTTTPPPPAAAAAPAKKEAAKEPTSATKKSAPQQQQAPPRLTEEGKQIPVGNGGSTDRYTWTQTLEECTVLLGVPEGVRAKDLLVEFKPETLLIRSKTPLIIHSGDDDNNNKNNATEPHTFVQGKLSHRIVPSESTWTLEGGVLVVVLYKQPQLFWERVLQGDEPPIDTTLVDSRRHIQTYDEATQAQIRKIMFDQQQQARGKPTSDELSSGSKPVIPPLPPGVEYIDQEILDEKTKGASYKNKKASSSKP